MKSFKPDPRFDLLLERVVDVPPSLVWECWTTPKHIKKWFTPAPWKTVDCKIDLQPGGVFYTEFESPEGQRVPNNGSFLEVVKNERLIFTNVFLAGYRPAVLGSGPADFPFTAVVSFKKQGKGTKYTALAIHRDEEAAKQHAKMGFQEGWGKALDQLVALAKRI